MGGNGVSNPASKVWWRYSDDAKGQMDRAYDGWDTERHVGVVGAHRSYMDECIKDTRTAGNSGYCRAVAPYWNARDTAYYVQGMSGKDAAAEGYKAMMERYNMPAPEWAWWV